MPEFRRIFECSNPMEVLGKPMEVGLIPDPSVVWGWDANFEDPEGENSENSFEICEAELFDRYAAALALHHAERGMGSFYLEDFDGVLSQSLDTAELLSTKFPGIRLSAAKEAYEAQYSYRALSPRQKARYDKLSLLKDAGYALTRCPRELVKYGTQVGGKSGAREASRSIARSVATKILSGSITTAAIESLLVRERRSQTAISAGRHDAPFSLKDAKKLEDTLKKAPRAPWPRALFDGILEGGTRQGSNALPAAGVFPPRYRYILLDRAARSAFERAFRDARLREGLICEGDQQEGNWIAMAKQS